jgi:1,4-alpha-glucan branching enzyme
MLFSTGLFLFEGLGKENSMVAKRDRAEAEAISVRFQFPTTIWADSVHLVGDFNDWDRRSHPLSASEDGWHISLDLERGRTYQYRYLLNGAQWCNDCNADGYVPNRLGGHNSVVDT